MRLCGQSGKLERTADCPHNRTHAQYLRDEFPAEIRSRIDLLGPIPDDAVNRCLQNADLFVAPSLYESFGLVFLEAMRWGTPVIGTRAGDPGDRRARKNGSPGSTSFARRTGRGNDHVTQGFCPPRPRRSRAAAGGDAL